MSNDTDKKKDKLNGDWDSALDEWERSPFVSLADDKTPVPEAAPKPPRPRAEPAPVEPDSTAAEAQRASTTTVRPGESSSSGFEDDDRTVVGEVPAELLADSIRGGGGASGLGQMFGKPSGSSAPDAADKEELIFVEDDSSVVTSAPDLSGPDRAHATSRPPRPMPQPPAPEDGAAAADALDPFADLKQDAPAASPAPPRPQRAIPPPAPKLPRPAAARREPAPLEPVASPAPEPPPPPAPAPAPATAPAPAPEPDRAAMQQAGPKLLEPTVRHFATDEVTAVFDGSASGPPATLDSSVPPPAAPPAPEHAPPSAPASIAPPPLQPVKPQWADEREAAAFVLDAGAREAWEQRVAWLAEEAAARQDPAERARVLLTVSELHAMVGDDEKAAAAAASALEDAPSHPLAHRQARALLLRDRRWSEQLGALDAEMRVAPTPEARVHCAHMQAAILERVEGSPEAATKSRDLAARVAPADPRTHLERLVRSLIDLPDAAPKVRIPDAEPLAPIAEAAKLLGRIRDIAQADKTASPGIYEAIPLARAALLESDTAAAAAALRSLHPVRGLGPGATWLSAALAAQHPDSRPESIRASLELRGGPHAALARRFVALRAVESGDLETLEGVMAAPGSESFSAADRVSLAALFSTDPAPARPFLGSVLDQSDTAVLGAAATAALEPVSGAGSASRLDAATGSPASRAAFALARSVLAEQDEPAFAARVGAFDERTGHVPPARLLRLECEMDAGRTAELLGELSGWGGATASGGDADRDRALAAALAAELLGDGVRARAEYERALGADPGCEAAVRVLAAHDPDASASRLADLARASSDDARGAVLLLEAALRPGVEATDAYDAYLRRALGLAPSLPFAGFLGERRARSKGEVEGVLDWIRSRREATEDPVEGAYDLCREAMLMVERDESFASSLLGQASAARPADVALRDLYERFSRERAADWVSWRVERAAELEGAERARLLLDAARDRERAGVWDEADRLAREALEAGAGELAMACVERCELAGAGSTTITDSLMQTARAEDRSVRERREARERLAELDELGRKDVASAMLWHRAILEETPAHLPSLRRLEQAYVGDGRDDDLEPIAAELSRSLAGGEADAHAMVAARVRLRESPWSATRELVQLAAAQPHPSLWATRELYAHARAAGDDAAIVRAATALGARADRDAEAAVLLAQAAQAQARLGDLEATVESLSAALDKEPRLLDAHLELASLLRRAGHGARAAEQLEAVAAKSLIAEHRIELWYQAALAWIEEAHEPDRGRRALEEAADIDITYTDVFSRLQGIYADAGERALLASLLERRLEVITDPAERIEMEVLRGKALAEVGDVSSAKQALAAALDANPDHVPALRAFAALCAGEDDFAGAEQALIRLARLAPDVDEQADIYRRLGEIYLDHLPSFERAEMALLEVTKRKPDDAAAQTRLVDVYRETGNAAKAVELGTSLLERASNPEEKRARTIQLALIHEQVGGNPKKAEQMLEKLFKEGPTNADSLRALAELHRRQGHQPALRMLLDRSANDARRSLGTGRFNPDLFSVLAAVGELRESRDAAGLARAAIASLCGEPTDVGAAGQAAFKTDLDDVLAPQLLTGSLRAFLAEVGDALDAAFPVDLRALRAGTLTAAAEHIEREIVEIAGDVGLRGVEIHVSPAIGPTCMPVSTNPPRLVYGAALIGSTEQDVRKFLTARALKIVQAHASVLSRTAPIDLLPLVCALIKAYAPGFNPPAPDPKRFAEASAKIAKAKPAQVPPNVAALALEIGPTIDNRASTLGTAVNGLGDRAALLAFGRLAPALKGIAWAAGHPSGPPASGPERVTWIGRNAEARELVVFMVSDGFLEARRRSGIAGG